MTLRCQWKRKRHEARALVEEIMMDNIQNIWQIILRMLSHLQNLIFSWFPLHMFPESAKLSYNFTCQNWVYFSGGGLKWWIGMGVRRFLVW